MTDLRRCIASSLSVFLCACGTARMAGQQPEGDTCTAKVEANAEVPGKAPDKRVRSPAAGFNRCYTESGLTLLARSFACDSGYALASLINIREPGFWNGPCYQADIEFYRSADGMRVSETPIVKYDTISPLGWQVAASAGFGSVLRGHQAHSGLVNEKGDTGTTSTVGPALALRYYFLPFLGLEGETGGRWGSINAPNTKAMDFTKSWVSRLGVSLIPWQGMVLSGRLQTVLDGGVLYERLALASDFQDFVEKSESVVLADDAATGFGWYIGGAVRSISRVGFLWEGGMRFEAGYPEFPAGTEAFTGKSLTFQAGIGYAFH